MVTASSNAASSAPRAGSSSVDGPSSNTRGAAATNAAAYGSSKSPPTRALSRPRIIAAPMALSPTPSGEQPSVAIPVLLLFRDQVAYRLPRAGVTDQQVRRD